MKKLRKFHDAKSLQSERGQSDHEALDFLGPSPRCSGRAEVQNTEFTGTTDLSLSSGEPSGGGIVQHVTVRSTIRMLLETCRPGCPESFGHEMWTERRRGGGGGGGGGGKTNLTDRCPPHDENN
ncbi:hypothetical protein EYF80_048120 [Liparis tanakae]|uniref:Uncharacterized protein n=1 Tax=Liparis tanakae TaxID=230148 RepID=A0A4Z2FKE0_9TELE|nr:hypothetical protein EYF80_048120 [Liparis tanakae]